jgi:protein-tyrosine phosphatase
MFSFFRKKQIINSDAFAFIGTDMHNHILPGIDDGSPDEETSKILIQGLLDLGFSKIISTPHILADLHPNTPETIEEAYNRILQLPDLPLKSNHFGYAAEYMIDYDFEEIIQKENLLFFGNERNILIEMSYLVESPNIRQVIFNLLTKGYQPILAHPERYSYYHHRLSTYEELVDAGAQLQMNLLSLTGHYGGKVQSTAERLIHMGLYGWVGTDMHHIAHLSMLQQMAANKKVLKTLEKIRNLKNPTLLN